MSLLNSLINKEMFKVHIIIYNKKLTSPIIKELLSKHV
jgi:hypothetical protein